MREMIQKIIVLALIALSAFLHSKQHIIHDVYHYAMQHSETVRTAAQLMHIIQTL